MQIDVSTVLTVAATLLTAGVGLYVTLLKYALGQKEKHDEQRHDGLRAKIEREVEARQAVDRQVADDQKRTIERLHQDELATIKLQGELAMLRQSQEIHAKSFDDLEGKVVTKQEFEARMDGLEKALDRLVTSVQQSGRYAPRSPSGGMSMTPDPTKR